VSDFREVQPLRQQRLIVVILIVVAVIVLVSLLSAGASSLWGVVIALGSLGLVGALILAASLETTVDREAIIVAFHFLWPKRRIRLSEVRKAEATKYHPFLDYGGYGVRLGLHGWAFNVSGDEGVLVETNDGSRLMIGSQRPKELEAAIERAKREQEGHPGQRDALTHVALERDVKGSNPLRLLFGP
jgi:preprotein translocase subunit SecG